MPEELVVKFIDDGGGRSTPGLQPEKTPSKSEAAEKFRTENAGGGGSASDVIEGRKRTQSETKKGDEDKIENRRKRGARAASDQAKALGTRAAGKLGLGGILSAITATGAAAALGPAAGAIAAIGIPVAIGGAAIVAANRRADQLARFSPDIARQRAANRVLRIQQDIEAAQELGSGLAEFEKAKGTLGRSVTASIDRALSTTGKVIEAAVDIFQGEVGPGQGRELLEDLLRNTPGKAFLDELFNKHLGGNKYDPIGWFRDQPLPDAKVGIKNGRFIFDAIELELGGEVVDPGFGGLELK